MKEQKHEIITNGVPNLENMPKEEFNIFCKSLLSIIEEEHAKKQQVDQSSTEEKKD